VLKLLLLPFKGISYSLFTRNENVFKNKFQTINYIAKQMQNKIQRMNFEPCYLVRDRNR